MDTTEIQRVIRGCEKQLYVHKLEILIKMENFLEIYKLLRLNMEEIKKYGQTNSSKGTGSIIIIKKKSPHTEKPKTRWLYQWILPKFKEELIQILPKLFWKVKEGGPSSNPFYEVSIILIPNSKKNATKWTNKTNKQTVYRFKANIPDESINAKIFHKILTNQIQPHIKRTIHHEQIGFTIWNMRMESLTYINESLWYITLIEWKKRIIIISIEAEEASDKIQHLFSIKALNKLGIENTYLNIIKAIYDEPITNIMLSGERLKIFLHDQEEENGAHLTASIQQCTRSPSQSNQARKRNKRSELKRKK